MNQDEIGVPMEQALSPRRCEKMREFLRTLVHYANQGDDPKVGKFLAAWRKVLYGSNHEPLKPKTRKCEYNAKVYKYRKEHGLCVHCGKPRGNAVAVCMNCRKRRG